MNKLEQFSYKTTIATAIFLGTIISGTSALASSFKGLGILAGYNFSYASDLSADGTTVVGVNFETGGLQEAFRWTPLEGMIGLNFLPNENSSWATAISAGGEVVAGLSRLLPEYPSDEAFRWTSSGGMVGLGFLPGTENSSASGISADGQVIVGNSGNEAFRWTSSGGMVGLGFLPGTENSSALGISADGQVVVGSSGSEAFRWTPSGGMMSLGGLANSFSSRAEDSSEAGDIIVGDSIFVDPFGNVIIKPFIWDELNGIRDLQQALINDFNLDLKGWDLYHVAGISDDGLTITGAGINPFGNTEAWIAQLDQTQTIPESYSLWGFGFITIISLVWCCSKNSK